MINVKTFLFGTVCATALCIQANAQIPEDTLFGDWVGNVVIGEKTQKCDVCMIPLGNGHYEARFFEKFGKQDNPLFFITGEIIDGKAKFIDHDVFQLSKIKTGLNGDPNGVLFDASLWTATLDKDTLSGKIAGKTEGTWTLKKTTRVSPTMGMKPLEGATVLFDGSNTDNFKERGKDEKEAIRWTLVDGAMEINGGDILPRKGFNDCIMHIEFRSPYMPDQFWQARGNSGVYINGAYEIQVLDSYGLTGENNECGGIYQASRPAENACFPPTYWQTYDIDFTAPRFDADGKKTANAKVTIHHNGIKIYESLEIPGATPGNVNPTEREAIGLMLQDHGNKVQYRNIWVLEK